jgi:hypothetical protein
MKKLTKFEREVLKEWKRTEYKNWKKARKKPEE